jgi:sialate O-acetylesterase
MKKIFVLYAGLILSVCSLAQIRLPAIIRDSMILQRDEQVNIWGWATAGEKITVHFKNKNFKTTTDAAGKWLVKLPSTRAGGPYTIDISGSNKITINNILFGDVWFCSGQSNMVHQMNIHDVTYAKDIAEANYPQIRQFWMSTITNLQGPQNNLPESNWKAAIGEDVRPFSAVAYFFARKIYEKYKVPIGIINASVGGPPIEAWISSEGLNNFTGIKNIIEKNKDTAYINNVNRRYAKSLSLPNRKNDKGLIGTDKWYSRSYIPTGWRNICIPGYWEDQGIKDLNGVVWYRKEIEVPISMTGKPARIFMGRIVDADELYINGKLIGTTGYEYPQRRYRFPADVLKAGKNIIVIRVTNTKGKGGFVPDKPYCIFAGTDTISLVGYWQYKVGEVYKPVTGNESAAGISLQDQPTALYNAMVAPVTNYGIKGFCWYQGETNTGQPEMYSTLLPALINDWRNKWKQDTLPFLFVQLPGTMDYNYLPSESNWARLRESQLKTLSVPHTGMAVAIDLGEWNELHPDNKKDVGERLALAAEKIAYGENIVYSGPLYQSAIIEDNKITLSFNHVSGGLVIKDGNELNEFAIAGADKKFVWANAKITGNKVVVWSDEVARPLYVRYAWADNPVNPNLYNKEGLPASPFRTDE